MFRSVDKVYCTLLEEKVFKKDGQSFPYATLTVLQNGKTVDFTLTRECPTIGFVPGEYFVDIAILTNGKVRVSNISKEVC